MMAVGWEAAETAEAEAEAEGMEEVVVAKSGWQYEAKSG